jgi:hypothetical protein
MQQGRVLDDQGVGFHDRLAQADLLVGDAAEGHHRRAGALGTETGEGLRVAALLEGRDGQHLGRRDDALTAAAVYSNLEHDSPLVFCLEHARPDWNCGKPQDRQRPGCRPGPVESRF